MNDTDQDLDIGWGGGGFGGLGADGGDGYGEDRRALIGFLNTLDQDLEAMLEDTRFLEETLREQARRAYDHGPKAQIAYMILLLERGWLSLLPGLAQHGLVGPQLDFKLAVHEQSRRYYAQAEDAWAEPLAKDYLECSDIILESLSSALGGAGAAVVEFKKMIEWLKGAGWRWLRRLIG